MHGGTSIVPESAIRAVSETPCAAAFPGTVRTAFPKPCIRPHTPFRERGGAFPFRRMPVFP